MSDCFYCELGVKNFVCTKMVKSENYYDQKLVYQSLVFIIIKIQSCYYLFHQGWMVIVMPMMKLMSFLYIPKTNSMFHMYEATVANGN